jgi:hypothetical protein
VTDLDVGQIKTVNYSPRVFGLATRICMPSEAFGPMGADRIVVVMFRLQRGPLSRKPGYWNIAEKLRLITSKVWFERIRLFSHPKSNHDLGGVQVRPLRIDNERRISGKMAYKGNFSLAAHAKATLTWQG